MTKMIYPILVFALFACAAEPCDCSEFKKQLERCQLMLPPAPINLPKSTEKVKSTNLEDGELTVVISKSGEYFLNNAKFEFEQLKNELYRAMVGEPSTVKSLKIAGHKEAEYQSIFKVLALCQENEWDPILAYDKS